jgi:glycerol-3-phosphate acyltransferase PlsX
LDADASRPPDPDPERRLPAVAITALPVALDAMGGDHAPAVVVEGAVEAARVFGQPVLLVGDRARVEAELTRLGAAHGSLPITVRHASEVVAMDESPAAILRRKKDNSIRVCFDLVKAGEAAAAVSAGNSGAMMALGALVLGRIEGVDRAAIATMLPTPRGRMVLLDAGANVDCKPQHLAQFAVMGEIYARRVLGIREPKVGLLTNGTEDAKGNDTTREALALIRGFGLARFLGNVEGRDIYNGNCDVVVCDGFVGNVALKTSEGLADAIRAMMREEIERSWRAKLGYVLIRPAFKGFERRVDYAEVGGAPLLGLDGVGIVSHGGSSARAIKNAIRVAATFAAAGVNRAIHDDLARRTALVAPSPRPAVEVQ